MIKKLIGDKAFYRRVTIITLPILIQNIITNFVSLIDNIMVGQVGTEQMTGVAVVNQLMFVFNICIFGGISGPGIFTAQYYGKNDTKGVRNTFRFKLIIVTVMTAIGILLCTACRDPLISLFLHEGEQGLDLAKTLDYGRVYIGIMIIQLFPFALMQAYAGTLRETGNTFVPMLAGVIAVITNTALNYLLIFGKLGFPELGISGAAIATVIARFVECLIVVVCTHLNPKKYPFIKGAYKSLYIPYELIKKIMLKGFPLMTNEILWSIGTATLVQCYSVRGLEVVSAYNISSTVSNLFYCAFFAFGTTISIIIGQLLGSGDLKKAKDDSTKILALVVAICVVLGGLMAILAPAIPEVYNTEQSVKTLACEFLIISAVLMPMHGFSHSAYFTLRSGGKTLVTFLFDSVFMWVICIPCAFILSRFTQWPIIPIFIAIQGLETVKCILGFILIKKGIWINNLVADDN
ncbi:MAG: MATE family efflux transporter [Clostridia bacterium]|nr:MATE family efflux transporter [Clostridia bacterium]